MELPIYLATISDCEDGIYSMSLVDYPATMVNWVTFSEDRKIEKFAIQNEEEHLLCGAVMLADTNIYRRDGDYEYYIRYDKETIKYMAEKMLNDKTFNNIDFQHNGIIIPEGKVSLVELFIKDESKGINPTYLEGIPDGSLLCTYKVNDEEIWELCKNGTFQGFSLSGFFTPVLKEQKNKQLDKKENFMNKVKEMIAKLLLSMGTVATDKGTLVFEGEELVEGMAVMLENGEPAEDGEYVIDEIKIVTVEGGIVKSIAEKEIEEPVAEEVAEEPAVEEVAEPIVEEKMEEETPAVEEVAEEAVEEVPVAEEPAEPEFDAKAEIEALKGEIEALKALVAEFVEKPAVEPITEEFEKVNEVEKTGIKGLDRAVARISTLKN